MVEAGGIEPHTREEQGLTATGQNRSTSGQPVPEAGHGEGVATVAVSAEGSNSGRTEASRGEKWNVPGASVDDPDLARVVAAWPRLRPELKAAILAIIHSANAPRIPEEASREGPAPGMRRY